MQRIMRSRRLFMVLSRLMAPGFRHGIVRSTRLGGAFCVLRTRGRSTGRIREVMLDQATSPDGGIWLAAGWGERTAWYRNLVADPEVEVIQDGGRCRRGRAEVLTDPGERIRALRALLLAAGVVGRSYGFDPETVPDERLADLFAPIPVVHVRFV